MLRQMRLSSAERQREVRFSVVVVVVAAFPICLPAIINVVERKKFNSKTYLCQIHTVMMSFRDAFFKLHPQAQLVKDRHSLVRMGSLYSDEEEEVLEAPPEKVQMTWTRERCEAEKTNKRNAPENFRELMSLKPSVDFH